MEITLKVGLGSLTVESINADDEWVVDELSLREAVIQKVSDSLYERVSDAIIRRAREVVEREIGRAVEVQTVPIIEKLLRDGLPMTNNYGHRTGKTQTLESFIVEHLKRKGYRSFKDVVAEKCAAIAGEEVKRQTQVIRDMVTAELKANVAKAVASAPRK